MLSEGNSKLGNKVFSFSIPYISTCPGRSELCEKLCYVDKYSKRYPKVSKTYQRNYELSLNTDSFISEMINEIKTKKPEVVRIHVSGDFYSNDYIDAWIQIVKKCSRVKFYAYSRSWNVISLRYKLREFGQLNNVKLWMSWDRSMPNIPASMSEFDVAYMTENEKEEQETRRKLKNVKLVFRNERKSIVHRVANRIVCPLERGKKVDLTCSSCEICF